jgi:molybdenum cofactor guanylyltransferase
LKFDEGAQPADEAAGFVLAGGMSSRMGRDKALVQLAGAPLVAHAVAKLREIGLNTSIAGARAEARAELSCFGAIIEDRGLGLGPLAGVCAGLAATSARYAVFLSIDLPLLPGSLPAAMLRRAWISGSAVALCSVNGFAQTFPAVVDRAALSVLESELQAGRSGCFAAFRAAATAHGSEIDVVAAEVLAQCGQVADPRGLPAAFWFLNVNTPAELERAQRLALRSVA